jgi:peptidyl-prolyl cis-trans isomerase D
MWEDALRKKNLGVRIMLGVIVAFLGVGMLVYLIPGAGTTTESAADIVAQVGDAPITVTDVRTELGKIEQGGQIPQALEPLYAQQVLRQLVFEKELELEAQNLGISVTDQERADRIRQMIPTAFEGDSFIGIERYTTEVQQRTNMSVPEFENMVTQGLVEGKFRQLVTDGISVTPAEVEQEFRRRNEKVKISYIVVKPEDLEAKIEASDADLAAYFEKNKARYTVPERRVVRYAFLNFAELRARQNVSEDEIRAAYNNHLDRYKLEDRAHVAHILFKTVGKTDAEVEEIRKKAEDVLKKAKSGANFGDLAKMYSDDTTKDKGGDLDWIVRGQTVPEFEKVAFSLPKGAISDLVKTQYGFHIIKVIDRETARTQTLDEVRSSILEGLQQDKAQQAAEDISGKIADDIRRSGRLPIDDLGKKYDLTVEDTQPLEAGQPILQVGNAPEIPETISRLRVGDLSAPIRTDLGYVVLSVKQIEPAHPGTLAEVRDRVLTDYRHEKAVELAKSRADELSRRLKAGEDPEKVAKSLGLEAKTSDLFARTGNVADVGGAAQLPDVFTLPVGQASSPVFLGTNWVVYRVLDHEQPNPDDLAKQRQDITQQLLDQRRELAFEAFRAALEQRIQQEGKLRYYEDNIKRLTNAS